MKTNDKNVLFLSGLFPNEIRAEIIGNSKANIQYAADALQWSILEGLFYYYKKLKVINCPFIGAFPNLNKSPWLRTFEFGNEDFDGLNVGYLNLMGIKNIDIYLRVKHHISKWVNQTEGEKVILIYHAYLPFLNAAIDIKNKYENVKICLILPDLPQFMNKSSNLFYNIYTKLNRKKLKQLYSSVDSYVLLTKYMIEKLPEDKPYTVVEGIFKNDAKNGPLPKNNHVPPKIILYTGTLAKRYGILGLLEAFKMINDENFQLVICGDGDAKEDIILAAAIDKRIIYKGSLDRAEVLQMQKEASLLVNPRTSEGEFTKFSFPSKTMEYLASGVPTLLYKLPGIPEEYYDYCFSLNGFSVEKLAEKIIEILQLDAGALMEMGNRAQQFILNNKNPRKQCKKIFDLIEQKQ